MSEQRTSRRDFLKWGGAALAGGALAGEAYASARVVTLEAMPPIGRELVRTTLKKTASSRGAANGG